jgi:hypothetical protein
MLEVTTFATLFMVIYVAKRPHIWRIHTQGLMKNLGQKQGILIDPFKKKQSRRTWMRKAGHGVDIGNFFSLVPLTTLLTGELKNFWLMQFYFE